MSKLQELPEEIITDIFAHLYSRDLLTLTLVCVRFNNIISNSQKLLLRLVRRVSFTQRNHRHKWIGNRKYPSFLVDDFAIEKFRLIVPASGEFVRTLSLWNVCVKYVPDILLACVNLRELTVSIRAEDLDEEMTKKHSPALIIDLLDFYGPSVSIRLFMNARVKRLWLRTGQMSNDTGDVKKFLSSQRELTELALDSVEKLFDDDALETVGFRLKTLTIKGNDFNENFAKFVANHKNSLTKLTVHTNVRVLELFRDFLVLKTIDIKTATNIFQPSHFCEYFNDKFPSVRKLKIKNSVSQYVTVDLSAMRKLETLEINEMELGKLLTPPLKKLKLENVQEWSEIVFGSASPRIEHLVLSNCANVNFLSALLSTGHVTLRSLMMRDCSMTAEDAASIERFRAKIEKVVIENCEIASKKEASPLEYEALGGR